MSQSEFRGVYALWQSVKIKNNFRQAFRRRRFVRRRFLHWEGTYYTYTARQPYVGLLIHKECDAPHIAVPTGCQLYTGVWPPLPFTLYLLIGYVGCSHHLTLPVSPLLTYLRSLVCNGANTYFCFLLIHWKSALKNGTDIQTLACSTWLIFNFLIQFSYWYIQ